MFGRKLAIVTVKAKRNTDDNSTVEPMDFEKFGATIVDTTAGVGGVVVAVASTLTLLRVAEKIVKHILK